MSKPIKTKYMYFLLPLTYVFVCIFIIINYLIVKDIKEVFKTIVMIFFVQLVFFTAVPIIISHLNLGNILDSLYWLLYVYVIGTIFGIYLIKKQQKYLEKIF